MATKLEHGTMLFEGVVGSRAYKLHTEFSDYDRKGVFLADTRDYLSLTPRSDFVHIEGDDHTLFELKKFVMLALASNPNVIELLYLDEYTEMSDIGKELISLRDHFLSKKIFDAYGGYAVGQFHRFENGLKKHAANWKNAMHLIRLMYCGLHALKHREVLVDMTEHREELLAIRAGNCTYEELKKKYTYLNIEFKKALESTKLPAKANFHLLDEFVTRVRIEALGKSLEGVNEQDK